MSDHETMTCAEVSDRLPLVPGADLLPAEDEVVRAHLADCVACRRALGAFVRIRSELRGLAPQDAGGVHGQFFAQLRADTLLAVRRDADRRHQLRIGPINRLSIAGVMTAAALFLIGVYLVSQWLPESSGMRNLPESRFPATQFPATQFPADAVIEEGRFRFVGYGLSGHRPPSSIPSVPMSVLDVDSSPDAEAPRQKDREGSDGDRAAASAKRDR